MAGLNKVTVDDINLLAVAGLAAWNYSLGVKNDLLAQKTEEQELQLKGYQNHLFHVIFMPVIIEFSRCIGTF